MTQIALERAEKIAEAVIKRLAPYCQKIEVAGSIRRRKPEVKDVDFVLIPSDPWNLAREIKGMGKVKVGGGKLTRVTFGGVQVDLYFASPETWATLLLIRTGPVESNIKLCVEAKKRGWHLSANGDGLFNEAGQRIAGDTEESIYGALGLPYRRPEERE